MASQVVGTCAGILEFDSFIRGYHAYKDTWNPAVGDVLRFQRETTNVKDKLAVSVMYQSTIIGHVSYNTAPAVSHFLRRSTNKATVQITGAVQVMAWKFPASTYFTVQNYINRLRELLI